MGSDIEGGILGIQGQSASSPATGLESQSRLGRKNSKALRKEKTSLLFKELQAALHKYLSLHPKMTINALSKKCSISEPTLRRISKGQVKTLPGSTTILDLLSTISSDKTPAGLIKKYPGAIAEYLQSMLPQIDDCQTEYNPNLHQALATSNSYLIYKMSSNSIGVTKEKIIDLLGQRALIELHELVDEGLIVIRNGVYYSKATNFTNRQQDFVRNFKIIAGFIKTKSCLDKINLNPVLANYSESVSAEAYEEISLIQKKALEKIRAIMSNEKSQGSIPLFLLTAIDTMDPLCAFEIEDKKTNPV